MLKCINVRFSLNRFLSLRITLFARFYYVLCNRPARQRCIEHVYFLLSFSFKRHLHHYSFSRMRKLSYWLRWQNITLRFKLSRQISYYFFTRVPLTQQAGKTYVLPKLQQLCSYTMDASMHSKSCEQKPYFCYVT